MNGKHLLVSMLSPMWLLYRRYPFWEDLNVKSRNVGRDTVSSSHQHGNGLTWEIFTYSESHECASSSALPGHIPWANWIHDKPSSYGLKRDNCRHFRNRLMNGHQITLVVLPDFVSRIVQFGCPIPDFDFVRGLQKHPEPNPISIWGVNASFWRTFHPMFCGSTLHLVSARPRPLGAFGGWPRDDDDNADDDDDDHCHSYSYWKIQSR